MKIDLCKIFGVEEGEEFRIKYENEKSKYIYKIEGNYLYGKLFEKDEYKLVSMSIYNITEIENIIKLPKKKKEFTDDELGVLRNVNKNYKWICRQPDGKLCVFWGKPTKRINWYNNNSNDLTIFNHLFNSIKWEDEEPVFIDDYVERGAE